MVTITITITLTITSTITITITITFSSLFAPQTLLQCCPKVLPEAEVAKFIASAARSSLAE